VLAVIAVLVLADLVLALHLPRAPDAPSGPALAALFAAMFAVAEIFVLHVQVRREAQTVALSEIPLVLALTFVSPHVLVVSLVVGAATAYVLHRRQRGVKLAYNISLKACDGLVAVGIYHLLLGSGGAFGVRWLLACYVVAAAVSLVDGLTTQVVIGLHEGAIGPAVLRDVAIYPVIALVVTTVPVVIAFALDRSLLAALPASVAAAGLVGGYRAYSRLNDRHLSLERLYRFSQAVTSTPEVNETLGHVLKQAKELLRSEHAEITFFAGQGSAQVRVALSPSGRLVRESEQQPDAVLGEHGAELTEPVLMPRSTKHPRYREYLAQRRWREAIVVPLRGDAGVIGTLSVADRMGEVRRFHLGDMRLLETVANHAGMALQNSRLIDQLRHESLHDALTGLPNRVLLRNAVSEQLGLVNRRRSVGAAVMIMDLDGFKEVNDTLGHQHGDELLKAIAGRTVVAAGDQCTVARLGGDEFALLVRDCADAAGAYDVAVRVLTALRSPTELDGVPVQVGASIGVALAPRHATDVGGLLRFADVAMYAAKSSGGGVKIYEADSDTSSPDRLALVSELRNALEHGEIGIAVQPQARLSDATVASVEVLARWDNPRRGLMLPNDFIPLVERLGLIHDFTVHVLRVALEHCARWRAGGEEVSIAVNLSARSLTEPALGETVARLLAESGVPAHLLTLEMTEHTVMADPDQAVQALQGLRDLGIRLSIDDFGVGYSSLSSLSRLPVQELKIDRSFVVEQDDAVNNAVIIRSIVDLGRNLGLDVVAEGVETQTAWSWVEQLGCHYAQGYLVGRPMSPGDLPGWLARWRTGRGGFLAGRHPELAATAGR
jgi:diguanylate cyclase (GGDEF)-like protein